MILLPVGHAQEQGFAAAQQSPRPTPRNPHPFERFAQMMFLDWTGIGMVLRRITGSA
jgi:hypothetical protein